MLNSRSGGKRMMMMDQLRTLVVTVTITAATFVVAQDFRASAAISLQHPTLWAEPSDLHSRNLYYGPGGEQGQPHGSLTFIKEDMSGTSPKFEVQDADGKKWKIKLGLEAQPEPAATRVLWAVGFFANENYFEPLVPIQGLPRLRRGQEFVTSEGVKGAR